MQYIEGNITNMKCVCVPNTYDLVVNMIFILFSSFYHYLEVVSAQAAFLCYFNIPEHVSRSNKYFLKYDL